MLVDLSAGAGRDYLWSATSSVVDVKFTQADPSMFRNGALVENGRGGSHEGGCVQIVAGGARESACRGARSQGMNTGRCWPAAWCPQSA